MLDFLSQSRTPREKLVINFTSTADPIHDNLNVTNALFQVQNYEPYTLYGPYYKVHIIRQTDCPTDANAGCAALSMHENTVNYI